ncbi:unnamed protein product, partial [Scytosiphon promiscuus]
AGNGEGGGWVPIRELLAYHLIPGEALFSRYFNESSPPTQTLALNGTAPAAASFVAAPPATNNKAFSSETPSMATLTAAAAAAVSLDVLKAGGRTTSGDGASEARSAPRAVPGTGTLFVNLETCSSTDLSASDGVLHVLAFGGDDEDSDSDLDAGDGAGGVGGGGGGGGSGSGAGGLGGSTAAGVLVPDVLQLTYAYGFRDTYAAILAAGSTPAALASSGRGIAADAALADVGASENVTVADALRGRAAHTLLAVADVNDLRSRRVRAGIVDPGLRPSSPSQRRPGGDSVGGGGGREADSADKVIRYQTLIGDQRLSAAASHGRSTSSNSDGSSGRSSSSTSSIAPPIDSSVALETLLAGADVHLFKNSENPGNPFYSPAATNGTGLNVNQAEVLSAGGGGMVALNGRIHQISEPLRTPAPDVFSLLSSHPQLSGWADWVELAGLSDLLSDPTAGPFTVFAPVNAALESVPGGVIPVVADKKGLTNLVRFHERSALSGDRFASGPRLRTLLYDDGGGSGDVDAGGSGRSGGGGVGGSVRVFLGPGGGGPRDGGVDLFLGAFSAEVVLPDMGAVNGVVHGISGIMTYPGYKRPPPPSSVE